MRNYLFREINRKGYKLNDMLDRIASAASGGMITMDDKAALDAAALLGFFARMGSRQKTAAALLAAAACWRQPIDKLRE